MEKYIERMEQEHNDLKDKIEALNVFIYKGELFKTLEPLEQVSLCKQLAHMEAYLRELYGRLWRTHN